MRPDRPEERAVGHFFYPGVDWQGVVGGPMGSPSPAHAIGVQGFSLEMDQGDLGGRRDVVLRQCIVAQGVDQGVGHAEGCDKVVNAAVL
ncbi:hypothetical protein D3C76_1437180 [compost metagenome]